MTKSFWTQSAKKWPTNDDNDDNAKFPSKSSVVVIGSGMSGVSVAYHLAKEGVDVIVLDSRSTFASQLTSQPLRYLLNHMHAQIFVMELQDEMVESYTHIVGECYH